MTLMTRIFSDDRKLETQKFLRLMMRAAESGLR